MASASSTHQVDYACQVAWQWLLERSTCHFQPLNQLLLVEVPLPLLYARTRRPKTRQSVHRHRPTILRLSYHHHCLLYSPIATREHIIRTSATIVCSQE